MNSGHRGLVPWFIACFGMICLFSVGCGPQHHHAFQQFSSPDEGTILSVQGYVLRPSEVANFKKNWNILAGEMEKKPGFKLGALSSGIGDSKLILAQSKWKDLESLRNAFSDKRILELEAKLPKKQFEHLFGLGTLGFFTKE